MMAFTDRVSVPAHVMVRILDNEAIFLNLETERYIGLDPTGTRMWQLLTAAPAISAAFSQLLDEYDVTPELLQSDLTQFLGQLVDNGLLQLVSSNVETTSAI
jgi:Coenzyme PQQ synthesis protein D (PqqD)